MRDVQIGYARSPRRAGPPGQPLRNAQSYHLPYRSDKSGKVKILQSAYLMTPSSLPTAVKAAIALSRCARSWAAEIWTRMRALPLGTTG